MNWATWFLGATVSSNQTGPWHPGRRRIHNPTFARSKIVVRDDAAGRAMLELAKRRMSSMDFVGLASRFAESMEVMAWKLGIPLTRFCSCNVHALKNAARSKGGGALSDEAKKAVLKGNALDVELYEHAKRIFESDYAAFKDATSSGVGRNPFVCRREGTLCDVTHLGLTVRAILSPILKKAAGDDCDKGTYFSPKDVPEEHAAYVGSFHNDCSFECERKRESGGTG